MPEKTRLNGPRPRKIYCSVCARQIVPYRVSDPYVVGGFPPKHDCCGKYFCHECGRDLNENGLFPEERTE
jgi:hypothetical protein